VKKEKEINWAIEIFKVVAIFPPLTVGKYG
jgi:hypothetical protein